MPFLLRTSAEVTRNGFCKKVFWSFFFRTPKLNRNAVPTTSVGIFCRPFRAWKFLGLFTQGVARCLRTATTRFALGYCLSGLQPFESVSIRVHPWLNVFVSFAFFCGDKIRIHLFPSAVSAGRW